MNLKSKIAEYFKTYWKNNVLLKSIAIVVTVCFLINISNLPAFAKDNDDELLKKRIKKQETNSGVLYQGDQTYGSVSYMQFLQDNTKVDDNDVISVKDKNGRFEAKGYWDPQTQQAMTVGGDGKYTYNETYTKVVKKIKGIEDETAQQQHASTQPTQEAAQAKTQTDAAAAAKSEVKNEQQKDEVVKTEQKISSTESDIKKTEQADRQSEEKAKLKAAVESANAVVSDTQKATTPNKPEGDDTIDNKPDIKTVQNIGNQDEKYDEVLNNLMRETGLSKEEIELEFAKLTDEQRENVISALYNLYRNNQSIVYCAADALGNVLNQIGSGALAVLAFGLIIADVVAGLFTENNKGLISGASSQLYISAKALQTVLAKYGKDYNGYTATIDDIVNGLGLGESVIVHVGGNHFITVSKNEDGTFTLSDINRPDKKVNLGSGEELNALLSVYFQGNNSTTVLAKSNGIFTDNKMLSDLSKIIGATTDYNDLLKNPAEAAAFYLEHGDKSYNELMKLMFGLNATLTHEQSIAFAQFYKVFLDQSIKGLSQKVSENKAGDIQSDIDKLNDEIKNLEESIASEDDDDKKKELQDQLNAKRGQLTQKQAALPAAREEQQKLLALLGDAAYDLAVIQEVQNILSDPKYNPVGGPGAIISGEIGQVLIPSIPIDVSGTDLPAGEYYLVITVTASYAGTREIQYGGENDKKDIPQYKVAKNDLGYSVSTKEGCTVTLKDGSQYKVFGVQGEFQGQQVIFQYGGYYQESTGKFYMSSTANIYLMDDKGSVYQEKDDPSASPPSSGKYGDVAPDRDNWSRGVITEDDNGYRISGAGSRITVRKNAASGEWKAVIVGLGTDALAGSKLKLGAKDKYGKDNSVYIEVKVGKMTYAGSYWAVSDGMVWKFDSRTTQAQAEAYVTSILSNQLGSDQNKDFVGSVKLISGHIDINTTFYGAPFSALTIMHECHLEFSVELKKGYVYDATSQGDIYKATFEQDTVVTIKEKDYILKYIATSAVAISVELPDGWEFENGSTSMSGVVINAGQEISLGSVLFNKKVSIQNTEDLEVVTGYEEREPHTDDDDGNPRLDYSKPITTKIGKGKLKVTGNEDGDYVTTTTIYINFTNKGWEVVDGTSNFYWEPGAKLNLTRTKAKDGKITYRMSITKGNLYVKDLDGVHVPKGDGDDKAKPKYKGPTFKGKVGSAVSDGAGGYIYGDITGVFKGVSGVGLTKDSLGNYIYAPGSELEAHSYAPDGTKSKYAFYVKDDGSIKQIGVKWYDKVWGAIKAIFKIIISVVLVLVLLPLVLAFLPLLLPLAGIALGLSFGLAKNKTLDFFKKTLGNIFKDWFASIYDDWNLREGSNHNTETAWKGGLAMVSAGFMAIVTAAIAIASIIAAIPSGGMSIAAGIAAIIGMVSAIAGAIQVGQMTYQAVLALSYGDLKNGFLMLGMAILLAVITVLGARGVGSAVSKGLESVAFVLKSAAVGAVVGSAVGAGVGALGNYIAHGIMTGEWSGEGAAKAAGEGAISGAIAGFFAGASMGINIASSIVKQAARETAQAAAKGAAQGAAEGVAGGTTQAATTVVAETTASGAAAATTATAGTAVLATEATAEAAGKTVGSVLAQEAAQGVGVSFSEGVSLLGRSVKEFFVGVSFVPVEGIKSVLTNVGRAVSHAVGVAFKLASMALDLYISYQAANTMVDAIRKGDEDSVKQFFSAAWTLISINLISPFMAGQSGIQSKKDMLEVAKAEVNAAQMEKIAQSPTEAINKMATFKGELETMFGNKAWLGHIGTGLIGAGLGVAAVYLIAWATKGEDDELHVSWREIVTGVAIGFAAGFVANAFSRLFGDSSIGAKIIDSIKSTFSPLLGRTASGEFSGMNLLKVWGSGIGGALIGAALVPLMAWLFADNGKEGDEPNYGQLALIGAGVGLIVGLGFGGSWINGKYEDLGGRIKASLFGNLSNAEAGQLPLLARYEMPIAVNSLKMSINMSIMSTRLTFASAILNKFLSSIGLGHLISSDGPFGIIDKVTGLGIFKKGEILFKKDFSQESMNDIFNQSFDQMMNPQTKVFSLFIVVLQPILTPALMSSPFLGTVMQPIASAGTSGFMQQNEAIRYLYENGVKERLSGVLGKLIFGDSMAGQIFQELFDAMPEETNKNKLEQLEFLASHGFDSDKLMEAINLLKSDPLKFNDNMLEAFKILGVNIPSAEMSSFIENFCRKFEISLEDFKSLPILMKQLVEVQAAIKEAEKNGITEKEKTELQGLEAVDIDKRSPEQLQRINELRKKDLSSLKGREANLKQQLKGMEKHFSSVLKKISSSDLTRFILNEVVMYRTKLNGIYDTGISWDGTEDAYAAMYEQQYGAVVTTEQSIRNMIESLELPAELSTDEQLNYLFAVAGLAALGVNIESIKQGNPLTLKDIQLAVNNAKAMGKKELAAELLLNYLSIVSNMPGRETEITDIVNQLADIFENIDDKDVTAKSLFMVQYVDVVVNASKTLKEQQKELLSGRQQDIVDRLFNIVGKQMVENFKDSPRLRDARIIELANLGVSTPEQQSEFDAFKLSEGEIAFLKGQYSPETLALNNYINRIIDDVISGKITYRDFRALMDTGDEAYFKGGNAKTNEYRVELRKLMAAESGSIIKQVNDLLIAGKINKEEAVTLKEQIFYARQAIAPTSYFNISVSIQARIQDLTPASKITVKVADGSFKMFEIANISEIKIIGQDLGSARLSFTVGGEKIEGSLKGNLNSLAANSDFVDKVMPQIKALLSASFLSDIAIVKAGVVNDIALHYAGAQVEVAFSEVNNDWDLVKGSLLQPDGRLRTDIFNDKGELSESTRRIITNILGADVGKKFILKVETIAKESKNLQLSFDNNGQLTEGVKTEVKKDLGNDVGIRFIAAVDGKYSGIVKALLSKDSFESDGSLKVSVIQELGQTAERLVAPCLAVRPQLDVILNSKDFKDGKMSLPDIIRELNKPPLAGNQSLIESLAVSCMRVEQLMTVYASQPVELLRTLSGNFAQSPLSELNKFSLDNGVVQVSDVDLYMLLQVVGKGNLTGAIADLKSLQSLRGELEKLSTAELASDVLTKAFGLSQENKEVIKSILEKSDSIVNGKLTDKAKREINEALTDKGVEAVKVQKVISNIDSVCGKMEQLRLNPGSNLKVIDFALPGMFEALFQTLNISEQDQKQIKDALFKEGKLRENAQELIDSIDGKYKVEIRKLLDVVDLLRDVTIFSKNGDLTEQAVNILKSNYYNSYANFKSVLEKAFSEDKDIRSVLKAGESKVNSIAIKIKDLEYVLNSLFENSGYSDNVEALLPRLEYLQKPENLMRIRKMFGGDGEAVTNERVRDIINNFSTGVFSQDDINYLKGVGVVSFVKAFLDDRVTARDSKGKVTKFADGTLDLLRAVVLNMEKNGLKAEAANVLKIFMIQANTMVNYSLRSSQSEMIAHFQHNDNVAVGMGGGKTISIAIDAVMTRVLMGRDANIEILVGNEDLDNYAAAGKAARKLFESLGMKAAKIDDYKPEGRDTDLDGLRGIYNDPDTVVIMSPTTRGHLKNEAISKGGAQGKLLNDVLNSVKRVIADEIHLWALTRTASVIGGDNKPPEMYMVDRAVEIGNVINAPAIYAAMLATGKNSVTEAKITMPELGENREVRVLRFKTEQELQEKVQNNSLRGDWIAVVGEQSASLKVKMSDKLRDDLTAKIKPWSEKDGYNSEGRLNSIIMGLFSGSENGGMQISSEDRTVKPVGPTGIQENMVINDIYRQLGFTLRLGLEGKMGKMSESELKSFMQNSTKTSKTSMQTSLAAIYSGARDVVMVGASGTVDGLQQLIINRTGAATVYNITGEKAGVEMFKAAWNLDGKVEEGQMSILGQQLKAAIENGDFKGLDNFLFLAKTQASFETIRLAIEENYILLTKPIKEGGLDLEIYEFTDRQGKWTDSKGTLVPNEESLSVLAGKTEKKRLIIANEMGATGIDYQGNFVNVLLDTHLMSDADLAQALKRTGRPGGPKNRWDTTRIMAYSGDKVKAQIDAFKDSAMFRERAVEMWKDKNGYMRDSNAEALFGKFVESGQKIDFSNMSSEAIKEMLIFVSDIRSLYDIDASIRFAVTDSIRDRMVLSVLRDLVATMPEGAAREAVQEELNAALESRGGFDKSNFSVESMKAESPRDVVLKAFNNVGDEVKDRFERLKGVLAGDENLKTQLRIVEEHMEAVSLALDPRSYFGGEPIIDKGLSSAVDLVEFVGIIRSFEQYIMPLETVADSAGTSSPSEAFASSRAEAPIMAVLHGQYAPGSEYVTTDANNEEVLTAKGKMFMDIQQRLSSKDNSMAWLMFFMAVLNLLGLNEERKNTYLNINPENPKEVAAMAKELTELLWQNAELATLNDLMHIYEEFDTNASSLVFDDLDARSLRIKERNKNNATNIKVSSTDMFTSFAGNAKNRMIDDFRRKIAGDSTLSIDGKLTQKGRLFVKIVEGFINKDEGWRDFLVNGPLGEFVLGEVTGLGFNFDNLDFETCAKLADDITAAFWKADIWDADQVEQLYGWYQMIPPDQRNVITSLSQLQGILTASHSSAKKQMAEQHGITLPSAMVIELAKLAKDFNFPEDIKGYKEILTNIVERNKTVDHMLAKMTEIGNLKSKVSASSVPFILRTILAGLMSIPHGIMGKYRMRKLQDSVRPDISEIFDLFPNLVQQFINRAEGGGEGDNKVNVNEFAKYIKPLMLFTGIANDKTDTSLDIFNKFMSGISSKDVANLVYGNSPNWKKIGMVVGGGLLLTAVTVISIFTLPISIPLLAAIFICVGVALASPLMARLLLGKIGDKFNSIKKIMDSNWFDKLNITDINKFENLETTKLLMESGSLDVSENLYGFIKGPGRLKDALNSDRPTRFDQKNRAFIEELSQEEKILILGKDMVKRMDSLKEKLINLYANRQDYKDRETDEAKRKKLVAKEFKWDMLAISKLIFEENPMTQEFIDSKEFKKLARNLLVVMFNDFKVEKNYDVIIERLQGILKQENTPGVVADDRNITIDQLADDRYFDGENKVADRSGNLARIRDQASRDILPVEAKMDRSVGLEGAGRRLVGKFGEGFTKPGEMQIALLKALCYFKNIGEMRGFLKLDEVENAEDLHIVGDLSDEAIAQAAFNTYKEALDQLAQGALQENEFNEVLELIRVVASVLMIARDKPEVAHMVDDHNYDAIQREITDMNVGVKAHVFVNVFKQQEGEMLFNIDIDKLKAVLQSDKKGKRVLSDKLETLMPMMRENKVRIDALTSIRHSARAVAASA